MHLSNKDIVKGLISTTMALTLIATSVVIPSTIAEGVTKLPMSDAQNSKQWVFDDTLSDDFTGTTLDNSKWKTIPFTWGKWRWEDDQVSVSDGKLHLNAKHSKNASIDHSPNGWTPHTMYDNDSPNGHRVTTNYGSRSGQYALVYGNFALNWIRTDTIITGLDINKSYTFSAWVKKRGHTKIAQMYACAADQKSVPLVDAKITPFNASDDYVKYTITGIKPAADGRCKLGFEVDSDPYALTIIDDVTFTAQDGSTANLAPNPSFEEADPINYASGGISSRQTMKYGYMETRAKGAPTLPGACSAIWLTGRSKEWGTEIDVLEIGQSSNNNQLDFALHVLKTENATKNPREDINPISSVGIFGNDNPFNPSSDYHVYGLEWGPGYQKFFVDGVLAGEFYGSTKADEVAGRSMGQKMRHNNADSMNKIPLFLYLSLGLRDPYRNSDRTDLNTTFDVDYVHVWRANNTSASGNIRETVLNDGAIVVPYGTTINNLNTILPKTVPVLIGDATQKLSLLNQRDVPVIWNTTNYHPTLGGNAIVLTGAFGTLPNGVTNNDNIIPNITINLENKAFKIDKIALTTAIQIAQDTYDNAVVGEAAGNYPIAAKNVLKTAIDDAQKVKDNTNATQQNVNDAVTALKTAVTTFEATKVLIRPLPTAGASGVFSASNTIVLPNLAETIRVQAENNELITSPLEPTKQIRIIDTSTSSQAIKDSMDNYKGVGYWRKDEGIKLYYSNAKIGTYKLTFNYRSNATANNKMGLALTGSGIESVSKICEPTSNNVNNMDTVIYRRMEIDVNVTTAGNGVITVLGTGGTGALAADYIDFKYLAPDKTALLTTINIAAAKHKDAVAGTLAGQYPTAAKSDLMNAINVATAVKTKTDATELEIRNAVTTLENAITVFEATKVFDPVTLLPYDIDANGEVNLADALYALKVSTTILEQPTGNRFTNGNVINSDNVINKLDTEELLNHLLI